MQRIKSTICENRAVTKEKSGVEHAGPIPSSESYPSFFLLLFLLCLPLPLISKRIKRRMRRIMILRMASLLFFWGGLAIINVGDGPTRLRFFAGACVAAERQMRKGLDS